MRDTVAGVLNAFTDRARCILSLLQPLTGNRSTGNATATATGADVVLEHDRWLVPVIGGQLDPRRELKVVANPATSDGSWTVTAAGTSLPIQSVVGGASANLAAGTVLRWVGAGYDVAPDAGISPTLTVDADMTGATNPGTYGGVASIGLFEHMKAPFDKELLKARLSELPAVMVAWTGMEHAEGSAGDRLVRTGYGQELVRELFSVYVVCNRHDDDPSRRDEGMQILSDARALLQWQQDVDGVVFSSPEALTVIRASRLAATPQFYTYALQLRVTHAMGRNEARVYSDWLKSRLQETTGLLTVVDDTVSM